MTGWRLGAAVGPEEVIEVIAKMNVNEESCTNHFVQYAGLEGLTGDQAGPRQILDVLRRRRDAAVDVLNSIEGVSCYRPEATFYLFPEVTGAMRAKGIDSYDAFLDQVLRETGVSLCARTHFGKMPPGEERRYLRLAYSGIDEEMIGEGLARFKDYIEAG
jgi:aspartate/methionine/tyrosine aminotransferase